MYCLNILYKHICGYAKSRLTYLLSIELRTNAILYVVVGFGSQENSTAEDDHCKTNLNRQRTFKNIFNCGYLSL